MRAICVIEGCQRPVTGKNYCNAHYKRWLRHGDPLAGRVRQPGRVCAVKGCDHPRKDGDYCNAHGLRIRKHGEPQSDVPIRSASPLVCTIPGCNQPHKGRGWCRLHWNQWRRNGDPLDATTRTAVPLLVVSSGERYGRWTVLIGAGGATGKALCRCECGTKREVSVRNLLSGKSKTCSQKGCGASLRHGMSGSSTNATWRQMLARCLNPKHQSYAQYGGRGITVCDRWNPRAGGSFENFLADMGERPEGMSIDREDNDGNYEPGNCRWATRAEQLANRRWITSRGLVRHKITRDGLIRELVQECPDLVLAELQRQGHA